MSNLLKDASILLTPTGYDNGSMNAIKPSKDLYGTELVTNGDFATDSDWVKETGWSISNGLANANSAPNGSSLYQNANLIIGKKYKITYEIKNFVSGQIVARCGNTFGKFNSSNGVFKETLICTSGSNIVIRTGSNTTCSIDNVSVVEDLSGDFTFSRNSAATRVNAQGLVENVQIISPELVSNGDFSQEGSELVTNGDFATDSDWSLSSGSSIANGKLTIDALDGSYQYAKQIVNTTIGSTYKLEFDITEINDVGKVQLLYNNAIIGETEYNSIGTYTLYFESTNSSGLLEIKRIHPSDTNASIDNVSVKEVGQDWDLGTGWSVDQANSKAICDGTQGYITQTNVAGAGVTATYKVQWTQNITVGARLRFFARDYNDAGNITTLSITRDDGVVVDGGNCVGSGTFTAYLSSTNGYSFKILAETGVEADISNISVKEITDDTDIPRIDYTDGCGSWLLEPQSTNLITYSEDFSNAYWAKSSVTLTSGFAAPDGSNNAYKIQGTINTSYIGRLSADTNQRSIYARTVSGTANINLLGDNSGFTVTEDWQRFEYNPTSNTYNFAVDFRNGTNATEVLIWGYQSENQSYATSYIPTNGATSTRLQDIANNSGNSTLINSTEGVLYAEIAALADDGTSRQISLNDGSYNNTLLLRYLDLTNTLQGVFRVGGAFKGSCNFTLSNPINSIKVAYKYKNSDFALWVNGAEVATSTDSFSISAETLTELSFDRGDGTQNFFGKNKALAVYKEALTDAQLQCLTTI